jgi:23S rRNA-intervening sequence protein
MPESPEKFLQKTGNYRALHAYRKSEVIYDFTFRFCEKFLTTGDRTRDQMIQAARSGKQNIAEGSKASVTSTETEIKLMNVARASLEELLLEYQDCPLCFADFGRRAVLHACSGGAGVNVGLSQGAHPGHLRRP